MYDTAPSFKQTNCPLSSRFVNDVIFGPTSDEKSLVISEKDIWNASTERALVNVDLNGRFVIFLLLWLMELAYS